MSFILDALKKSESERQRQSGPGLFEVKVAPPRHRFAVWAIALGTLLAINLVVVGWMLTRGASARRAASSVAPAVSSESRSGPASGPSAVAAAGAQRSSARSAGSGSPAAAGAAVSTATGAAISTATGPSAGAPAGSADRPSAQVPARAASARGAADSTAVNPEDLAPAVEPPQGSSERDGGGSVAQESESSLPTYQDAAAVPGASIPPLRLDFHVYSATPDQRFVFLNMTKLREGDSLPQGVRVDAITPDGVILSYRGTTFVLH